MRQYQFSYQELDGLMDNLRRLADETPDSEVRVSYLRAGVQAFNWQEAIRKKILRLTDDLLGEIRNAEIGRGYSAQQSEKGQAGADARWSGRRTALDLAASFARRTDSLGDPLSPGELWSEFFSVLEAAGLQPQEGGGPQLKKQWYDLKGIGERVQYLAFAKQLERLRRPPRKRAT